MHLHAVRQHIDMSGISNTGMYMRAGAFSFPKTSVSMWRLPDLLIAQLPGLPAASVASSDLLLRWAAVRLCEPHGNTTCLVHVLDLVCVVFDILAQEVGRAPT